MQLDRALFDQIAATLGGERTDAAAAALPSAPVPSAVTVAAPAVDQRQGEPRVGSRSAVTVIPLHDRLQTPAFEVALRDLSAGGIGFIHSDRMGLDEQFVVLLPEGRESVAVLCQVAHYQPLAERSFAVGARFVRVLRQPAPVRDGGGPLPLRPSNPVTRRAAS